MLSERQRLVLVAIVEEYVKTNEPVGSLALCRRPELNFSSATLRNEMAHLEEMGYLEKTHTSSGRVPSQRGYRLYVEEVIMTKDDIEMDFSETLEEEGTYTLPAKHTSTTESYYYNILVLNKLIKIQYFVILTNKIIQSSINIGK